MSLIWSAFGEEWSLSEKVGFNGITKRITVNAGVSTLSIREDVYSAWIRWIELDVNTRFLPAMRQTGLDPIPGGFTGATYFMINGWKLEYDANVTGITGVLYSDDYETPFWSSSDSPIYPATVSSLVNSAVTLQNVVTGDLSSIPTEELIAARVRVELALELSRIDRAISSRATPADLFAAL